MLDRLFKKSRPSFREVAAGLVEVYEIDVSADPDLGQDLAAVAAAAPRHSPEVRRLRSALRTSSREGLVDALGARPSAVRCLAARLCGLLELDEAVPWLEMRLSDRNHLVREAAARALGRIGGRRSCDALLRALARDRVPWFRLTVELAKAAPLLYLEGALGSREWEAQRPALIAALGLRRTHLTAPEFLAVTGAHGPRELVAACHAVARRQGGTAWVAALLDHPDRRVRAAADRALRRLRVAGARSVFVLEVVS